MGTLWTIHIVDSPPLKLDYTDLQRALQVTWPDATVTERSGGCNISYERENKHSGKYRTEISFSTTFEYPAFSFEKDYYAFLEFKPWLRNYLPDRYKLATAFPFQYPASGMYV
ncbi:MAG: hypothetical protein AAF787_20235, partial [Chloroflexota bacterium]